MGDLLFDLDRRAKLLAARESENQHPNLIVLPPSPAELARLLERTAEFRTLGDRNPHASDLLKRSGYYHTLLRGEQTDSVLDRLRSRLDAKEVKIRTLMLLYGCEFAKDFELNRQDDPRVLRRSIRWISEDEIERLCPPEDVCESFYPSENPRYRGSCGGYWFFEEERIEPPGHLPAGDEVRDYFNYFLFDEGFWKYILPVALYSSEYFSLPVILQLEPTWKLYRLRTAWPIIGWETNYRVTADRQEGLLHFMAAMTGATSELYASGRDHITDPLVVAARRFIRARLRLNPYLDDDEFEYSLLDLITGLEALLIFEKEPNIVKCLSDRASWLSGRDEDERQLVTKIVKEMYDQRSRLTHEGVLQKKGTIDSERRAKEKRYLGQRRLVEIARRAIAACVILKQENDQSGYRPAVEAVMISTEAQDSAQSAVCRVCDLSHAARLLA